MPRLRLTGLPDGRRLGAILWTHAADILRRL
jgi:hypothetical protein